jgi:hypothetical protein
MRRALRISLAVSAAVLALGVAAVQAQQSNMTFFVTSTGLGKGADLGGLDGADAHCNALAKAVGSKLTNWRAYLSTTAPGGDAGVNARDRIGKGPWRNAKGVVVAKNVADLHSPANNPVNQHDILTGSDPLGMYSTAGGDTTCGNWTKSGDGSAIVGHHDRAGLKKTTRHMTSWNSSHGSRGCSQEALKGSGGAGLLYCFSAN